MTDRLLQAGIDAFEGGRTEEASKMLSRVIQLDPHSLEGWFWLAQVMTNADRKIYCLRRVLKLDPDYDEARSQLKMLGYTPPEEKKPEKKPPAPPPPQKASIFEPVPTSSSSPFVWGESGAPFSFDDDEEEEVKPATVKAPAPLADELAFLQDVAPEPKKNGDEKNKEKVNGNGQKNKKSNTKPLAEAKKKKRKNLLIFLGISAFLSVLGVFGVLFTQPAALQSFLYPPTATWTPSPTPTPTIVPTATPLPFSALTMGIYTPIFETTGCDFEIPQGEVVVCGDVIVPENRYGDVNDTIRIAVAIYRGENSAAPPTLYLQGGPGLGAIVPLSANHTRAILPLLGNGDLIIFDQRGTGLSEPSLNCPETNELYTEYLRAERQIPFAEREQEYLTAFADCQKNLSRQGVQLSSYNTTESAADVRDILRALGREKATLLGVSYGTRLAQMVMREYPEVVHAAVLDSVLPLETMIYNQSAAISREALNTLFAGCAADHACDDAYPNLEEDLLALVQGFDITPLRTGVSSSLSEDDLTRNVDGDEFMSAILWAMRQPELLYAVPQAIGRAKSGDANIIALTLAEPINDIHSISLGAYLSINCREQVYSSSPEKMSEDLATYPDTDEIGLSWVYGDPDFIFSLCDIWQSESPRPDEHLPLTSDIPTLILAGQYDSTTPPSFAEQLATRLSRATLVKFPGLGHGVAFTQNAACPINILQAFLANPELPPDTSCAAAMPAPAFSTPYNGNPPPVMIPIVNQNAKITTSAPADWQNDDTPEYIFRARNAAPWDMTSISAQHIFGGFDTWLTYLIDNFQGTGLDSYPIMVGETQANGLNWKLYESTLQSHPVDFAFAQDGYDTVMVSLVSHTDEHEILYKEVFLQTLNTTKLLISD